MVSRASAPPHIRTSDMIGFGSCNEAPMVIEAAIEPGPQLTGNVSG